MQCSMCVVAGLEERKISLSAAWVNRCNAAQLTKHLSAGDHSRSKVNLDVLTGIGKAKAITVNLTIITMRSDRTSFERGQR